jgi:hypothetical protein
MTDLSHHEPRYEAFLFASLCEDDEMVLSVLSVLARQDLDPWQEAARLAEQSKEQAINSFAARIWQSNSERWSPSEASLLAIRLIALLPPHCDRRSDSGFAEQANSRMMLWLVIGTLLGSIALSGNTVQKSTDSPGRAADQASMLAQQDALPPSTQVIATD